MEFGVVDFVFFGVYVDEFCVREGRDVGFCGEYFRCVVGDV